MKILIKNCLLIDGKSKYNDIYDVLITDGFVSKIEKNIKSDVSFRLIDGTNKVLIPGIVDAHVHLREPGFEDKETVATGTKAAVYGGVTTMACMPNTNPTLHSKDIIEQLNQIINETAYNNVVVVGSLSYNLDGKTITNIDELFASGIVALSDDGKTPLDEKLMKEAFLLAKKYNLPILSHCEDHRLTKGAVINEGLVNKKLGLKGSSNKAEYLIVDRDIKICEEIQGQLHICHVSAKESLDYISRAKAKGENVTCEIAPHHFIIDESKVLEVGALAKVNPPLRKREDVQAMIEGIKKGVIDIIATDHAPHTNLEKSKKIEDAPFGISGIETSFALSYTYLVKSNVITMERLVEMMCLKPAEILGIDRGYIEEGAVADLAMIDLEKEVKIDRSKFISKGKNTPFDKIKVSGQVEMTMVNGDIKMERGDL